MSFSGPNVDDIPRLCALTLRLAFAWLLDTFKLFYLKPVMIYRVKNSLARRPSHAVDLYFANRAAMSVHAACSTGPQDARMSLVRSHSGVGGGGGGYRAGSITQP